MLESRAYLLAFGANSYMVNGVRRHCLGNRAYRCVVLCCQLRHAGCGRERLGQQPAGGAAGSRAGSVGETLLGAAGAARSVTLQGKLRPGTRYSHSVCLNINTLQGKLRPGTRYSHSVCLNINTARQTATRYPLQPLCLPEH